MLSISDISKAYAGRTLFADVTMQLNRADRVGLVGPNGAGKSTLFNIILGNESPDTGEITRERGMTLGYLPQETAPVADETVIELALSITPDFVQVRRIIHTWDAEHPAEASHPEAVHTTRTTAIMNSTATGWRPRRRRSSPGWVFARRISTGRRAN